MKPIFVLLALALLAPVADARIHRSQSARVSFVRAHVCPATGLHKLPCPGWIIDHHVGLCVGGADKPDNMRWMTVSDAKAKDKWECRVGWEQKLQAIP